MTYSDGFNIRTSSVKFNDVADAIDGTISRGFGGTTTGTSTAYIASPSPAWTSYDLAASLAIIPHVTNAAGPVTINISGLGPKEIRLAGGTLAAGVLVINRPTILIYTGVYFEVTVAQNALLTSGSNSMLANLNFGGFIPTNVGAGSAGAPAFCARNDQTTGMYSPAVGEIGFATAGVQRVEIDGAGRTGIGVGGDANPEGFPSYSGPVLTVKNTNGYASLNVISRTNSGVGSVLHLAHSRGTTAGSFTPPNSGDIIGMVRFVGANSLAATPGFYEAVSIRAYADGAPTATSMAGRLSFLTTPTGSLGPGNNRLDISSDGDVGVGVFASRRLHVRHDVSGTSGAFIQNLDQVLQLQNYYVAGVGQYSIIQASNAALSGFLPIAINPSGGNVGIGTTAPNGKLTIVGGAALPADIVLRGNNNPTANEFVVSQGAASEAYIFNRANTDLIFGTNNTTRMRIFNNGVVTVTTDLTARGIYSDRTAAESESLAGFYCRVDGVLKALVRVQNDDNILQIQGELGTYIYQGGIDRFGVDSSGIKVFKNGKIVIINTAISQGLGTTNLRYHTTSGDVTFESSSRLIKKDIIDCPYGLQEVLKMQPRKYFRMGDNVNEVGFVADEALEIVPELVPFGPKKFITKDESDEGMIPINFFYDKFTAVLCKAIQELYMEVQTLKEQVHGRE